MNKLSLNSMSKAGGAFAVTALLLLSPKSPGAVVTGSFVTNLDGSFTYSYSVDNTAGSFPVAFWSLELNVMPDWNQLDIFAGGDVSVPSLDWIADAGPAVPGTTFQDFISLSPTADVPVGSSMSGFSFTSNYKPGSVTYYATDSFSIDSSTGQVVGPVAVAVPEPGMWAVGCGLLGVVVFLRPSRSAHNSSNNDKR